MKKRYRRERERKNERKRGERGLGWTKKEEDSITILIQVYQ